jgi:hypothetical protein
MDYATSYRNSTWVLSTILEGNAGNSLECLWLWAKKF